MQTGSFRNDQSQTTSVVKIIEFFQAIASIEFSGKVVWLDASQTKRIFFYDSGQLLFAVSDKHCLRRWRRNVQLYYPQIQNQIQALDYEVLMDSSLDLLEHKDYAQIHSWVQNQKISPEAAGKIIQGIVGEILFDLFRSSELSYKLLQGKALSEENEPIITDGETLLQDVQHLWMAWQKLNIDNHSPDQAPVIRKSEQIRDKTNEQLYHLLVNLLDGRNTLRDVAIKTKRDIIQITQALKSFIKLGWIDLIDIPDYAPSASAAEFDVEIEVISPNVSNIPRNYPLIACVDDSASVCQSMERIVKSRGYQFVAVLDAQRALSTLLLRKPNIIFLDLVMPYTNGYEICSRLRKVSKFSNIPIIILSGNDGVVDQVRARLMGATDFVSKPVDSAIILNTIHRYLEGSVSVYQ
jgi:chemotaxis family two-component system response regulator PixG